MYSNELKINKLFIYWLFISLILVFLIIIIGGLTRLTNSGLSITEWELFKGIIPPLNENTWEFYFEEYIIIYIYLFVFHILRACLIDNAFEISGLLF